MLKIAYIAMSNIIFTLVFQAVYRKVQELGLQQAYNQDAGTYSVCSISYEKCHMCDIHQDHGGYSIV